MVNRVCYYDAPNLNGVMLPADTAEQYAQTLVDMPVYAKCRINDKGEPTFGSHEVHLDDESGELIFDTVPIGVHTSVEIKEDTVTINGVQQTLPCLFATQKIWTRNRNAVAAIKRLFSEGKLHNSWELCNNAYTYSNGLKTITDYSFVGNTLLGYEYADPAYGESAKVLSISEAELMVAEALSRDLLAQDTHKEDTNLEPENVIETTVEDVVLETSLEQPVTEDPNSIVSENLTENPEAEDELPSNESGKNSESSEDAISEETEPQENPETTATTFAELTSGDIRYKIMKASYELLGRYCWVAFLFPESRTALLEVDEEEYDELEFTQVEYMVSDDEVSVSNPTKVKLAVSIAEMNQKIGDLQDTIATLNQELNEARNEISDLLPYREAADKAAHDEAVAKLKAYAEESMQFTQTELESEEMISMFEALNESAVKAMIADRVVSASLSKTISDVQTKVVNANVAGATSAPRDAQSIMRDFFS